MQVKQNLYKNSFGNKVIFEEINEDLGYHISDINGVPTDVFGFVKNQP